MEPQDQFLVSTDFLERDVHGTIACTTCHGGDLTATSKEGAHRDIIRDPTYPDPSQSCGPCHRDITALNGKNVHVTLEPFKRKVARRCNPELSGAAAGKLEDALEAHCMTCHGSCGQCHVSRPDTAGGGLTGGHRFMGTPPDDPNCISCHGTRVGDEYRGRNEGIPGDVHYRSRGMTCNACHHGDEMHGAGQGTTDRYGTETRARCDECHAADGAKTMHEAASHRIHRDRVSCQACHALPYKHCSNCHLTQDSAGTPLFEADPPSLNIKIGLNPAPTEDRPDRYVTLRHVPVTPHTFDFYTASALTGFDRAPTWKPATPHTIQRKTPQNRRCTACHDNEALFLTEKDVAVDERRANRPVIAPPLTRTASLHDWLPETALHLERIDCIDCHGPSAASPVKNCDHCHN